MSRSRRPLLLDLYCGAGGAGHGYALAGFDVVGVDLHPQVDYPYRFIRHDAVSFCDIYGAEYDIIHASPPCQNASALTAGNRRRHGWTDDHPDLIPATRAALTRTRRPWIIENVQGSALRRDLTLCGLSFGLRVFRHRYFELSDLPVAAPAHIDHRGHRVAGWRHGVRHDGDMVAVYGDGGGKGSLSDWQEAMGMPWAGRDGIREAIPPAYTRWLGEQAIAVLA